MSQQEGGEALVKAFAMGVVAVAEKRGDAIDALVTAVPEGFWQDVCAWLNEANTKTANGKDWTTAEVSSYGGRKGQELVDLCRELSAEAQAAPATQRIAELWDDGIPVPAILAILTQEGFTTEAGELFSLEIIAQIIEAVETQKHTLSDLHEARETSTTPDLNAVGDFSAEQDITTLGKSPAVSVSQEASIQKTSDQTEKMKGAQETVSRKELIAALARQSETFRNEMMAISETFRKELTALSAASRNELRAALEEVQHIQTRSNGLPELPPAAPLRGLRKLGNRVKIAGTIDKSLMDLLEAEQQQRNITRSTMIDLVVWQYFGKPPLSFEAAEPDQ